MCIESTKLVWERSEATGAAFTVLLRLADHANNAGLAWPSVPSLAHYARADVVTVRRSLRRLEALGEIAKVSPGGGRQKTTTYRITLQHKPVRLARVSPRNRGIVHGNGEAETRASGPTNPGAMHENPCTTHPEPSRTVTESKKAQTKHGEVRRALRAYGPSREDFRRIENRQSFANRKIAEKLGWPIVMAANDPTVLNHATAVALAKAEALRLRLLWHPPGTPEHEAIKAAIARTAKSAGSDEQPVSTRAPTPPYEGLA